MIPDWLREFRERLERPPSQEDLIGGLCLCDCCHFPTLNAHGGYEICPICWWQDDPEVFEDIDRDSIVNKSLNLAEARQNFLTHQHAFDVGNAIDVVKYPNGARNTFLVYLRRLMNAEIPFDEAEFFDALEKLKADVND